MACFILTDDLVDLFYHWLGVPVSRTAVPMIESYLAAKMQHQGFQRWRRIEFEAYVMQFLFGRHQFGAETA